MVAPHYRGALALLAAVIATACRGTSDPGNGIEPAEFFLHTITTGQHA